MYSAAADQPLEHRSMKRDLVRLFDFLMQYDWLLVDDDYSSQANKHSSIGYVSKIMISVLAQASACLADDYRKFVAGRENCRTWAHTDRW